EQGCVDGLPFMPEMLRFCGQRVQVRAVAHKTCEVALQTAKGRRRQATVHLGDLRCDGSAHGGCQAECTLFWRDVWLKPSGDVVPSDLHTGTPKSLLVCNEEQLLAQTLSRVDAEGKDPCYSCQATKLYGAPAPLESWWDLHVRQYIFDVVSRNHSLGHVLRVGWLAALRKLARSVQGSRYVHAVCWR